MNILFMGTPDFALESLRKLYEKGYNVTAVVTRSDKQQGRKMELVMPPVKEFALQKGLGVYQPESLKNGELKEALDKEKPDLIVVVAYGKILPKYVLDYPKYGCINLHGSILPKLRGSAPIQWSVIGGDEYAGATTMYMDEGLDTGDIIDVYKTKVGENETAGELYDRIATEGAELLCETVSKIFEGTATRTPQNDEEATYAPMLTKEMGKICFDRSAVEIYNQIRGLNPWPVAYLQTNKGMLKVYTADVTDETAEGTPGEITDKKNVLIVQTAKGKIELKEVQLQGKKRMNAADFLRGAGDLCFI
ncbi:MAG: methionyl-tRNA formyltransferase [Clostridia bacterium]|nr:methionyl-tRNA formyltransferase [Clostridia bacterium]